MRCLDNVTDSMDMNLTKLQEVVEDRGALCAAVQGLQRVAHDLATVQEQRCLRACQEQQNRQQHKTSQGNPGMTGHPLMSSSPVLNVFHALCDPYSNPVSYILLQESPFY